MCHSWLFWKCNWLFIYLIFIFFTTACLSLPFVEQMKNARRTYHNRHVRLLLSLSFLQPNIWAWDCWKSTAGHNNMNKGSAVLMCPSKSWRCDSEAAWTTVRSWIEVSYLSFYYSHLHFYYMQEICRIITKFKQYKCKSGVCVYLIHIGFISPFYINPKSSCFGYKSMHRTESHSLS